MNIKGWFPIGLIGLISLPSKELSGVFSKTTVLNSQFFGVQSSLWSNSHICTWLPEKPYSKCWHSNPFFKIRLIYSNYYSYPCWFIWKKQGPMTENGLMHTTFLLIKIKCVTAFLSVTWNKSELQSQSRPNLWAMNWYSCQTDSSIRLEIKCTIKIMCLNHPETIPPIPGP